MSKKSSIANVEAVERRRHWRDRRAGGERRSSGRLHLTSFDCRTGLPRRTSDVAGELADGEVWWQKDTAKSEC